MFGEVVEGFDTLTVINAVEVDENCKPVGDGIQILWTEVYEDPFEYTPELVEFISQARKRKEESLSNRFGTFC